MQEPTDSLSPSAGSSKRRSLRHAGAENAAADAGGDFDWSAQIRDIVLDRDNGVLLHVQLRTSLRRLIEAAPENSAKLPPENELVKLLNVAPSTVRKSLDGLVAEGLIERRRAFGTMIKPRNGANWLKTLAVIMPNYPSHTISAHLSALNRQMGVLGGKMSIIPLGRGDDWQSCSQRLDFSPAEGGVVFFNSFSDSTTIDLHNTLCRLGYRSVLLGHPPAGLQCNRVVASTADFIRSGLQRLLLAGHRRICFLVGEPEDSRDVQDRVRCFNTIAAELGLSSAEAEVVNCGVRAWENAAEAATEAIDAIWDRAPGARPAAIFAVSDGTAVGASTGLARRGVRVPDEVSILSYDGTEMTRITAPKLDSLLISVDKFAAAMTGLLADRQAQNQEIQIKPDYREGGSIRNIK